MGEIVSARAVKGSGSNKRRGDGHLRERAKSETLNMTYADNPNIFNVSFSDKSDNHPLSYSR